MHSVLPLSTFYHPLPILLLFTFKIIIIIKSSPCANINVGSTLTIRNIRVCLETTPELTLFGAINNDTNNINNNDDDDDSNNTGVNQLSTYNQSARNLLTVMFIKPKDKKEL